MIPIDRNRLDESGNPIMPGEGWFQRAHDARETAISEGKDHDALRDVYAHHEVQWTLQKLFYNKCAYCEYSLIRTDVDVDHHRPKGRVHEVPDHPGYYWLAYEWSNLLPACKQCNQLRRDLTEPGQSGRTPAKGKGDKFPLLNEAHRAYSPRDNIKDEDPLLIDPTVDDPSEHMTFNPLGEVVPLSDRGTTSIDVYNLNTKRMNDERKRSIKDMICLLKLKLDAAGIENDLERVQCFLADIEKIIRKKTEDHANYAAAARAVIKRPSAFGL